ncbi:MAG: hypothetical protein PF638_01580 [Candidatus Delongbacteria bacterium]|jgi:hypothetical protein|nr:hypothetical protein [Candidatus Delongbacteria bacterium]
MKNIQCVLFSLVIALLLFSVGCTKSEENKNSEVKKIEVTEKENIKQREIDSDNQSSIESLMPEHWEVLNSTLIPAEKLDVYSRTFGGKIVNFENNFIGSSEPYNHYKFQINVIKALDVSEAKKIFDTIYARTSNKEKYLLKEDLIYEFMANDAFTTRCREIFSK